MSHRLYNMLFRWVVHVCVCARVSRSISSSSSTSFLLPNSLRSPNLTTLTAFKLVSPILLPIIIIILPLYLSLSSILLYSSTIIFTSLSSSSFGTFLFPLYSSSSSSLVASRASVSSSFPSSFQIKKGKLTEQSDIISSSVSHAHACYTRYKYQRHQDRLLLIVQQLPRLLNNNIKNDWPDKTLFEFLLEFSKTFPCVVPISSFSPSLSLSLSRYSFVPARSEHLQRVPSLWHQSIMCIL